MNVTFMIEAIILLPTVAGNLLILICLYKYKRLRTSMGILIGNLALTDLITGAVLIPLDLYGLKSDLYRNKHACLFRLGTFVVLLGCSILNMLGMSLERFVALAYPLKHMSSKTKMMVKYYISFSWVLMIVIAYIPHFGLQKFKPEMPCIYTEQFTEEYIHFVTILFSICIFINIGFFGVVIRIVVAAVITTDRNQQPRCVTQKKKSLLMLVLTAMFMLCWGPFCVLSLVGLFYQWETYNSTMRYCILVGFLNSCFNWIIYGLTNTKFRKAIALVLGMKGERTITLSATYSNRTYQDTPNSLHI